jgi:methyl-accepting chemotaxis protein
MSQNQNTPQPPPLRPDMQAVQRAKFKRRNYWVDPKVQWAIIQKTLLLNAAVIVMLYVVDKLFFIRMEKMGSDLGLASDHVYFLFMAEQQRIKFWMFLATSGIVTVVGTLLGIRFSHRIAGPIFRLKKEFRRLNQGEKIEEVNLRNADFFLELADEFNTMTLKHGLRKDSKGDSKNDAA